MFGGWLLAGLIALAFSGCGDKGYYTGKEYNDSTLLGLVGDSTAVFVQQLYKEYCEQEGLLDGYICQDKSGTPYIRIKNFYTDSLVWETDKMVDFYDAFSLIGDTAVFAYHNKEIIIWNLNDKTVTQTGTLKFSGCSLEYPNDYNFSAPRIRPWTDGKYVMLREDNYIDSCAYGILDLEKKTVVGESWSEETEWLKACDDYMAQNGNVFCTWSLLDSLGQKKEGLTLLKNAILSDTLRFSNNYGFNENRYVESKWLGSIVSVSLLAKDNRLLRIDFDKSKIDTLFPILWTNDYQITEE